MTVSARQIGTIFALLGTALVVATNLGFGSYDRGTFLPIAGFTVAGIVPYVLLYGAGRSVDNRWMVAGAGAAALTVEAGIRASVFLFPRGSTAALALVFSPAFVAVVALPAGALCGYVAGRLWPGAGITGRALISGVIAVLLTLTFIDLGRPDLFPTTVAQRRAQRARIGDPRVVTGGQRFESAPIWPRVGWFDTGRFADAPDELVAFVDADGIRLIDPADGQVRETVRMAPAARQKWNWSTRLVKLGARLVLAQTGGGYQDTELIGLDGVQIWRYRPSAELPPTAMLPADLDSDGEIEFYVSDHKGLARVDASGHEVWRRDKPMIQVIGTVHDASGSGRILAYVYGDRGYSWTPDGESRLDIAIPRGASVMKAVNWQQQPAFVLGGERVRVVDLQGETRLDVPFGDFRATDALDVRTSDGANLLAVVGTTPREVNRWRLALLQTSGEVVFDQILSSPVRLLKTTNAAGEDTLLVVGEGLQALRPRR
jgi:hypothetical protein